MLKQKKISETGYLLFSVQETRKFKVCGMGGAVVVAIADEGLLASLFYGRKERAGDYMQMRAQDR